VTIREALTPALQDIFHDRGLSLSTSTNLVAKFPAECPDVGNVLIYDDGEEATVLIENITHHHANPYDGTLNADERSRLITDEVVEFLRELFADRVLLWSIDKGAGGGGWRMPFEGVVPADIPSGADIFVWSRRLRLAG